MSDNSSFPLFVSSTKKYLIGESELNDWTKIVLWKAITIFIMTKITQNRQDTKLWNTQKKDKKVKMFFFLHFITNSSIKYKLVLFVIDKVLIMLTVSQSCNIFLLQTLEQQCFKVAQYI